MYLKPGVSLKNLQPQMLVAMMVVKDIWAAKGINNLTITSCNDSKHMDGSLHYKGLAFDVRTKDVNLINRNEWLNSVRLALQGALTDEFDVVLEYVGGDNEHIHIEYQPKKPIT
jgi:hypothetical protein